MNQTMRKGGGQPWLGIRMLLVATVLLIATCVSRDAQTFPRYMIVVLWWLTSVAAMLKERVAYGMGDRVTLFGVMLIAAVTGSVALVEHRQIGRTSVLTVLSVVFVAIVLFQAVRNVRARMVGVAPWE
jgi:hypothetical protein